MASSTANHAAENGAPKATTWVGPQGAAAFDFRSECLSRQVTYQCGR
jgi:hypothetical protein